jgi:hypothetical protein
MDGRATRGEETRTDRDIGRQGEKYEAKSLPRSRFRLFSVEVKLLYLLIKAESYF